MIIIWTDLSAVSDAFVVLNLIFIFAMPNRLLTTFAFILVFVLPIYAFQKTQCEAIIIEGLTTGSILPNDTDYIGSNTGVARSRIGSEGVV